MQKRPVINPRLPIENLKVAHHPPSLHHLVRQQRHRSLQGPVRRLKIVNAVGVERPYFSRAKGRSDFVFCLDDLALRYHRIPRVSGFGDGILQNVPCRVEQRAERE